MSWQQLIAERDLKVKRIYELQARIREIDAQLEKDPPPPNVCVAVWVPKKKKADFRAVA